MFYVFGFLVFAGLCWGVNKLFKSPLEQFDEEGDEEVNFSPPEAATTAELKKSAVGPFLGYLEERILGLDPNETGKILDLAFHMRPGREATVPVQLGELSEGDEELQFRIGKSKEGKVLLGILGTQERITQIERMIGEWKQANASDE